MRCLTIMEAVAKICGKQEILFVCADEASAALAERNGFQVFVLHTDYWDMASELPLWDKIPRVIKNTEANAVLVDSYYVTNAYLACLQSYGRVYLMDDMQEEKFDVTCVINYNAFADHAIYERLYAGTDTRLLLGASYVPLREGFFNRHYQVKDRVEDVLVTTGGGDVDNIACKVLQAIEGSGINYHVVVGQYNPHYEEVKELARSRRGLWVHHDVADMPELMLKCDLAVTAGGTTVYELAALGIPFLCFSYARNQEALASYIGDKQIAGFCGAYHKEPQKVLKNLAGLFREYCASGELRLRAHSREKEMVDGLGAGRLAGILTNGQME